MTQTVNSVVSSSRILFPEFLSFLLLLFIFLFFSPQIFVTICSNSGDPKFKFYPLPFRPIRLSLFAWILSALNKSYRGLFLRKSHINTDLIQCLPSFKCQIVSRFCLLFVVVFACSFAFVKIWFNLKNVICGKVSLIYTTLLLLYCFFLIDKYSLVKFPVIWSIFSLSFFLYFLNHINQLLLLLLSLNLGALLFGSPMALFSVFFFNCVF